LEHLKLARPQDLVGAVYGGGLDRSALAALAPIVVDAALAADVVAVDIVEEAARQLAGLVAAAAHQLGLEREPFPLAIAGGVLLSSTSYRSKLLATLTAKGFKTDPVTLVPEPAEGAIRRALATT
jgi:N-acetylglucosamine kinase-like BadF-type ATPase